MTWALVLVSDYGAAWSVADGNDEARIEASTLSGTLRCHAGEPGRKTTPYSCTLTAVSVEGEGSGQHRLGEVAAALEGAPTRLDVAPDGRVKRFWSFDVELPVELRSFTEDAARHLIWCLDLQRPEGDEPSWRQKHNVARIPLQVDHHRTDAGAEVVSRPSPSTTIHGAWSWDDHGLVASELAFATLASTGDIPMAGRPETRRCTATRAPEAP